MNHKFSTYVLVIVGAIFFIGLVVGLEGYGSKNVVAKFTSGGFVANSSIIDDGNTTSIGPHLELYGRPPSLSNCGAGASFNNSAPHNDMIGRIIVGSAASSCTLNFNQTWDYPPFCIVDDETNTLVRVASVENVSAAIFSDGGSIAGDTLHYFCVGGKS